MYDPLWPIMCQKSQGLPSQDFGLRLTMK
jgi:hypothetical protein